MHVFIDFKNYSFIIKYNNDFSEMQNELHLWEILPVWKVILVGCWKVSSNLTNEKKKEGKDNSRAKEAWNSNL